MRKNAFPKLALKSGWQLRTAHQIMVHLESPVIFALVPPRLRHSSAKKCKFMIAVCPFIHQFGCAFARRHLLSITTNYGHEVSDGWFLFLVWDTNRGMTHLVCVSLALFCFPSFVRLCRLVVVSSFCHYLSSVLSLSFFFGVSLSLHTSDTMNIFGRLFFAAAI